MFLTLMIYEDFDCGDSIPREEFIDIIENNIDIEDLRYLEDEELYN